VNSRREVEPCAKGNRPRAGTGVRKYGQLIIVKDGGQKVLAAVSVEIFDRCAEGTVSGREIEPGVKFLGACAEWREESEEKKECEGWTQARGGHRNLLLG
jgi:hypothetical protein